MNESDAYGIISVTFSPLILVQRTFGATSIDPSAPPAFDFGDQYDTIGNREQATEWEEAAKTTSYTTNALNQYPSLTIGSQPPVDLTYDLDGNLIDDGIFEYAYDAENRLIAVTPLNPASGLKKTTFAYDYQHRRSQRQVYEWQIDDWSLSTEHWYVYDGWNVIKETTTANSGNSTEYYVWGLDLSGTFQGAGGIGGLLSTTNSLTGTTFLYTFDLNGNVGQLVESSTGTIAAHYEYDPFGNTLVADGPEAENNPYRFSTKPYMPEFGWYDYGYRFYAPWLGRWPTRDPIEEDGGVNLYSFGRNNSIQRIDFLGQFSQFIDCCPCQENALANDEQLALQQIEDLMYNIQHAISKRPQGRVTNTESEDYGKFKDLIARNLEEALRVLKLTKKKRLIDGFFGKITCLVYRNWEVCQENGLCF